MSLTPIRLNDKYKTSFQSSINNNSTQRANTPNKSFYLEEDVFDDGKIGIKKGLKHFFSGVVSPIKILISSPKNMLIGAGAIVGSAALCAAFPPLLPIMVATGVATGSAQLLNGGFKALTAKSDKQAEEAWESIGSGTFAIGTSVIGAKSSLKAAGISKADDLSILNATLKCFKEIPAGISKSFKMAKNGTFLTSLKTTVFKPLNHADIEDMAKLRKSGYDNGKLAQIKEYSEMLHQEGLKSAYPDTDQYGCVQELIDILPDNLKDSVKMRVKSPSSIKDKLVNKLTSEDNPILIDSIDDARKTIGDLIGTCIAMDNPDEAQLTLLVEHLSDGLRDGKIKFLQIDNYRGKGITPYFSSDHLDMLREAAKSKNIDLNPFEGFGSWEVSDKINKIKPSGYTTTQINVQYKDGALGEFQIRGKGIQKLTDVEHIPYDLRKSKDLSGGNLLLRKLYKPLEKYVKLLSNEGYSEYNDYLNALYRYYRKVETGAENLQKPLIADYMKSSPSKLIKSDKMLSTEELQKTFNTVTKVLDIEHIEKLHGESSWLKTIPRTEKRKVILQNLATYLATEPYITKQNINN